MTNDTPVMLVLDDERDLADRGAPRFVDTRAARTASDHATALDDPDETDDRPALYDPAPAPVDAEPSDAPPRT